MIWKDDLFQQYAKYVFDTIKPEINNVKHEDTARNLIYKVCLMQGANELDNIENNDIFKELLKKYELWYNKQNLSETLNASN